MDRGGFSNPLRYSQSYTLDDIVFGGDFMPCLVRNYHGKNNVAAVDLSKFHQTIMEHEE